MRHRSFKALGWVLFLGMILAGSGPRFAAAGEIVFDHFMYLPIVLKPLPAADLTADIVSLPRPYAAGAPITYTVTLFNAGPETSPALTLTHTFEGDAADLPAYISGDDVYVPAGEFHANVLLFPAVGSGVTNLTIDGEPAGLNGEKLQGRTATTARVSLAPGQSTTLTYTVDASVAGLLPPAVVQTPGPRERAVEVATDASPGC